MNARRALEVLPIIDFVAAGIFAALQDRVPDLPDEKWPQNSAFYF